MLLGRDKPRGLLAILELLGHGRLWVKRVCLTMRSRFPVFPYEPTSSGRADWSVSCQKATWTARTSKRKRPPTEAASLTAEEP
jgi:hypothetical protein